MATETHTPVYPKFVPVEHKEVTALSSKADGLKFRLVSYNILAQACIKNHGFPHSPSPCLEWKARSSTIIDVLKNLDADILCLQESDEYDKFYKEKMEQNGYSSIYVKRNGRKVDGCGIFYKHNKMELVLEKKVDYDDLANLVLEESKHEKALDTNNIIREKSSSRACGVRFKCNCVGIMAAFKFNKPHKHYVIVANTHIFWDPKFANVKLAQAKYLLCCVDQFKRMISEKFECKASVLIAGDFNSVPGSKVYQYLVSGGPVAAPSPEHLGELPMPLCSAYAYTRGEPPFTNCTPGFTGTLDYILFSPSDSVEPVSYLELPELGSPDLEGGLPNFHHPSDHLPIGAEFVVCQR